MVKGTSRQVIVVHAPEEKLFDQAIFILRDGAASVTDEALLREAKTYLESPRKGRGKWRHSGPVWGMAGAGIAWLISMLV